MRRRSHTTAADGRKISDAISIRRRVGDGAAAEEHEAAMPKQFQAFGGGRDEILFPILFRGIAFFETAALGSSTLKEPAHAGSRRLRV